MKVKIKKLNPNAVIPKYSKFGDAGMDLVATSRSFDENGNIVYGTGLAFEIPHGYVGLVFPRSSLCKKKINLTNSVGVIDSGYRGEVMAKFKPSLFLEYPIIEGIHHSAIPASPFNDFDDIAYKVGDRIAQIVIIPYPTIEFDESEELSNSERGEGGYGSTGN